MEAKDGLLMEIRQVDALSVTVITDNYYDAIRPDTAVAKRFRARPGMSFHAEHGLSFFVETFADGESHRLLLDYGMDPAGVLRNMELLDIPVGKIDALALSHGHFDHWGGLVGFLRQNSSRLRPGTPLYLGKEPFERRFSHRPGEPAPHDIGRLDPTEVEAAASIRIEHLDGPVEVIPGGYLLTNIEMVTGYEQIPPSLLIQRGEKLEQDTFQGELAFCAVVKGKGLVVLAGCAHRGIVNTVRYCQEKTGTTKLHAVLGGFHLINAAPELIDRTVEDIRRLAPAHIVPTHCTGFEAIVRFSREMPDQFTLNTAGTRYTFAA
jgi:7,8-dihydropterin-6-yl-methyl-4-(beta-D-ribofuranosyl)aminobenzene 5'-phosphate synthase